MIFIATRVPYPPVTGHYLRTFNILRGLSRRYAVHFFGFEDNKATAQDRADADQALSRICASVHIEPVGSERSKTLTLVDLIASLLTWRPYTAPKYFSRRLRNAIQRTCETHPISVAHADSLPSGQYLINLDLPKLITNHNVEYQRLYRYAAQRGSAPYRLFLMLQARLTKRYELKTLRDIGNCVTVSEQDRAELNRQVRDVRFFVVPNGTDASAPVLPQTEGAAVTALWVGGMNDPFNREGVLHFASRILPLIRARLPGFQWIVVGRDPPPRLRELADEPDSGVILTGFVPSLRELYERTAIVVVPLISGGGTKLKVLEAMAMGRAVVTTSVGAEGIAVQNGVEMEIASTDQDFAGKVVDLLNDPAHRNRMAAAARALAEREYSWEMINRRMQTAVEVVTDTYPGRKSDLCAG